MTSAGMHPFHGKLLEFPRKSSELRDFLEQLPKREDFLQKDPVLEEKLAGREPVLFLPNDLLERHHRGEEERLEYQLLLFGILSDGSKAAVVLEGIEPFFDVEVPPLIEDAFLFGEQLFLFLKENKRYTHRWELTSQYPLVGFVEEPRNYLRFYFRTLFARTRALEYVRECVKVLFHSPGNYALVDEGQPLNLSVGAEVEKLSLNRTAADDKTCYYRKVARDYRIRLCDWNLLSGYRILQGSENCYTKPGCVKWTFLVHISGFKEALAAGINIQADPVRYRNYLRDKSLVMAWDTETSARTPGAVPMPGNVFSGTPFEQGGSGLQLEDQVFMDGCSFSWYLEQEPFLVVNLTDLSTPPREDSLIILCRDQVEIIRAKSLLVGRMCPEFLVDFNGGSYDWPFLLRISEEYDRRFSLGLVNFMKKHMSVVPWTPENEKYGIRGKRTEEVKLEAGINAPQEFFDVPGFLCIDTRTVFRQLYPTAEKSSLNFFLSVNKLGSKEDMPYQTMFKINRVTKLLSLAVTEREEPTPASSRKERVRGAQRVPRFEELLEFLEELKGMFGADWGFYNSLTEAADAGVIPFSIGTLVFGNTDFGLHRITLLEAEELLRKNTEVVHYCNIDARRCQDLLRVRNVISDRREIASLSFTSMYDAMFRAGGMKVRNLTIAEGIRPEHRIAFSCIPNEEKKKQDVGKKYPGAYVVPPRKGLYRDHVSVKLRRRKSFQRRWQLPERVQPGELKSQPQEEWGKELWLRKSLENYPPDEESNDQNSETDRPCAGLDFSSLYPSLIMTYNFSPEKFIDACWPEVEEAQKRVKELEGKLDRWGKPYRFVYVEFPHDLPGTLKPRRKAGWFVQHHPVEYLDPETGKKETRYEGFGIYAVVLKKMYDARSAVKKKMEYFAGPKEFLEKFFERNPRRELQTLSLEEQKKRLLLLLQEEKESRERAWQESQKPFFLWKVKALKEVEEWFKKEFLERAPGASCVAETLLDLYEEVVFFFNYYNTKQLGLKVIMNTLYGESGNALSPFFVCQVAGGITTYGQKNIKFVKHWLESRGYSIKYGDTDSLYISPPESYFQEVDLLWSESRITKKEYWTRMIEITMEVLDKTKVEVGELLFQDNGTRFLKMDYEEVLWPYAMVGKKKYLGVQHQGIVNLSICSPECSLSEFQRSRLLFIRGLEVKKRGASDLLKQVCFEIMQKAFSLEEERTLREVVLDTLSELPKRKFPVTLLCKSARYRLAGRKPDGTPKPGNVTVLRFVDRMKQMETLYPNTGVRAPELGERFNYIIARRFPWCYDLRGRKCKVKVGDRMEFSESLENPAYCEARAGFLRESGTEIEPDIDYYITGEVVGQLARFLTYHPEYDKFHSQNNTAAKEGGEETEEQRLLDEDELFKKADKQAHGFAKKQLTKFYKERAPDREGEYQDLAPRYQKLFKETNEIFSQVFRKECGSMALAFEAIGGVLTGVYEKPRKLVSEREKIRRSLHLNARRIAREYARRYVREICNKENLFRMSKHWVSGLLRREEEKAKVLLGVTEVKLNTLLLRFEEVCLSCVSVLQAITLELRDPDRERLEREKVEERIGAGILNLSFWKEEGTLELLEEFNNCYSDLITAHRVLIEGEYAREDLEFLRNRYFNPSAIPPGVQQVVKMTAENLQNFLQKRKSTVYAIAIDDLGS